LTSIVDAVADLDTFAQGPCDDLFCPFGCGYEQYVREFHDDECPITLARRIHQRRACAQGGVE